MKFHKLFLILLVLICSINCSTFKKTSDTQKKYKLEKVEYSSQDINIKNLMYSHKDETKFKKGQPIKESIFAKERKRITKLMRKNKYPDFSIDKVSFVIDTTISKNKFTVTTVVKQ